MIFFLNILPDVRIFKILDVKRTKIIFFACLFTYFCACFSYGGELQKSASDIKSDSGTSLNQKPSSSTINAGEKQQNSDIIKPEKKSTSSKNSEGAAGVDSTIKSSDQKPSELPKTNHAGTANNTPLKSSIAPPQPVNDIPAQDKPQASAPPVSRDTLKVSKDKQMVSGSQPARPAPHPPSRQIIPVLEDKPAPKPSVYGQAAPGSGGKVTLNFDDADIYTVIQTIFGEILQVNYAVDPKIKGRVTFRAVAPVDRDKVLPLTEVILRLNGIAVVEDGVLNRIVPIGEISREPVPISFGRTIESPTGKTLLKIIPIRNMSSADMIQLLAPFTSEKAVIVNVPNTNQIIVVDTDSTVKRLIQLIDIFDTEQQKPRGPKVYVYHIQNGSAKEVTQLLQNVFMSARSSAFTQPKISSAGSSRFPAAGASSKPSSPANPPTLPPFESRAQDAAVLSDTARIVADENANSVIIYATPEDYAILKDAIEKIDVTPRQVLIEALILDVLLTDNLSLGVNAFFKTGDFRFGLNTSNNQFLNSTLIPPTTSWSTSDSDNKVQKGLSILKLPGNSNLSLFITALAEKTKLKVLSAPHTIVSDSKEAEISIADTVQITSADIVGTTTIQNTTLYQQKDVGTILKVTPRIHEGGLVTLRISQEVSQVAGDISQVKQGTLFHKTLVKNELVAMDGETIIIGGLIREDTTKARSGIPLLSSIPLLGWLFGSTSDNVSRRELIVLLTPRVITNQKEAARITEEYIDRLIRGTKTGLTRGEINDQIPQIKKGAPGAHGNDPAK